MHTTVPFLLVPIDVYANIQNAHQRSLQCWWRCARLCFSVALRIPAHVKCANIFAYVFFNGPYCFFVEYMHMHIVWLSTKKNSSSSFIAFSYVLYFLLTLFFFFFKCWWIEYSWYENCRKIMGIQYATYKMYIVYWKLSFDRRNLTFRTVTVFWFPNVG